VATRKNSDLVAGAVVLVVAIGFLGYAFANTGHITGGGYTLHAKFDHIDGLADGSAVRIAGVQVGSVNSETIDTQSFEAAVSFTVANDIKLPKDSSVSVTSDGLLGGKYLNIEPGGDTAMIPPGGTMTITTSSISIEQLLGKFIFSAGNLGGSQKPGEGGSGEGSSGGAAPPAAAPK
jgi:phospholipid/cholesterol/gamma-HCH transport system substrate-binding protein